LSITKIAAKIAPQIAAKIARVNRPLVNDGSWYDLQTYEKDKLSATLHEAKQLNRYALYSILWLLKFADRIISHVRHFNSLKLFEF
jgi:hypothetical protein